MMSFFASLYSRGRKARVGKRTTTPHDVFMFEAIVGKPTDLPATDTAPSAKDEKPTGPAIPAVVKRAAWKPAMANLSVKLRAMYDHGMSQKRPQVADWLRHLSDQAAKRIDQAQARLNTTRPDSKRRRVEAKELLSIRPTDPQSRTYKHVA